MIKNEDTYCVVYHKIVRELGAWEAVVYSTIASLLRKTDGIGEVSNQTLMDICNANERSLRNYINRLITAGYIEKRAGDGRGNISIYYITKKGADFSAFKLKKGEKNDIERAKKMQEKGENFSAINKGENKEIKKESGGDTRDAREHPALSNTTTQNFNDMENFNLFWELYPGDPNWSHEKENCELAWHTMLPEWRKKLIEQLKNGLRWRVRENDNPVWYLRNYDGRDVQGKLPFIRQGSVTFDAWHKKNLAAGVRMCLIRYDGIANCLYDDLQTMVAAGAEVLNDDWK